MEVRAHPDPFALEEELLARVESARAGDPLAPVLIVVPTVRLAAHVQRRLAERFGACLGVDVLHHRALVLRILDRTPGAASRPASTRLREALLARVLQRLPDHSWSRYVAVRPGALAPLARALDDLREAGITPEEAAAGLRGGRRSDLASLYAAYAEALLQRRPRGFTDETGLVETALPGAAAMAARYRAVLHHGAYDLIGAHLALVREMDRGRPVTFLLPAEPGAPAFAAAERFARRYLLPEGGVLERIDRPAVTRLGERLATLYDEESRPHPLDAGTVVARHAQGASAEVAAAVRGALAAIGEGVPPEEVALVARTLSPYGPALEEATEVPAAAGVDGAPGGAASRGAGIPWTTSSGAPLRREPDVREVMLLLRTAAEEFPRGLTAELLRSPRIRWQTLIGGELPDHGEKAESWSRRAGLAGGVAEWTEDLAAWAGTVHGAREATDEERVAMEGAAARRRGEAERIGRAVEALARRVGAGRSRRWSDHADAIEKIVDHLLPGLEGAPPPAALDTLLGLVDEMRSLQTLVGDDRRVPFAEMVQWLERAVDATEISPGPDNGGLRVLDAMQARGLTFRRVFLFGFQSGLFPRPPREDPILPDDARRRLRDATGRPLAVKSEGEDEERLLLALMLGGAREGLEILWQRSDEQGRPRTPSMALREVARLVLGAPDMETLIERAHRIRSHPKDALEDLADQFGMLSPAEELLLLALRSSGDPAVEESLLRLDPGLSHGLRMMRATESLAPGEMYYDGRVGRVDDLGTLSVTAVELLGSCPLKFFFRERLRVIDLEEEIGPFELAAREMGVRVHRLLELLYGALHAEGRFPAEDPDALQARAQQLLDGKWQEAMGDLAARFGRRAPLLWSIEERSWRAAVQEFLKEDLARIVARGWVPEGFEDRRDEPLALGPGVRVRLRGRFDRVMAGDDGPVVGDYKTSGNLVDRANVTNMLKGHRLQVPLYRKLMRDEGAVEILGVGPEFAAGGRRSDEEERRVEFSGFGKDEERASFDDTLRVLLSTAAAGRYPLRHDDRACGWCDYRRACRHNHPPSRHREDVAGDGAGFRLVQKKSTRAPFPTPAGEGE